MSSTAKKRLQVQSSEKTQTDHKNFVECRSRRRSRSREGTQSI